MLLKRSRPIAIPTLTLATLIALMAPSTLLAEATPALEGWLSIAWGDAGPGAEPGRYHNVTLTADDGRSTRLSMSPELLNAHVLRWNGRRVTVFPSANQDGLAQDGLAQEGLTHEAAVRVAALQLAADSSDPSALRGAVTGSQPWISLLCKFSDISAEPENLSFFQNMYANSPGRLDHYWREVSAGQVDIVGSTAVDWVDLPGTQVSYAPTPGSGTTANLNAVFNDCTAAVDAFVDFSGGGEPYAGINIMVNDALDCCAWGGSRFATLDGITKSWRTTWNPPWAFRAAGVIAHEMGHGFGLPHANNWDGDSNPYDSPWDVMSSATGYAVNDGTYGALGKHVNAHHKDSLGWFAAARRFVAPPNSETTLQLDDTALANSSNYQFARIDTPDGRFYTVESRIRRGNYEGGLVSDAVIIHEVDFSRSEPSWSVDEDVPPANYADNPGTIWLPGETFTNAADQVSVRVDFATADGFTVTITRGEVGTIFQDGFESGDTSFWSEQAP